MFSPQVFWRIDNLIKTLTKKNNKTHTAELAELTKMYDTSSKAFLIASLLDEIDFRDQRTTGHKDTQKVQDEVPPLTINIFLHTIEPKIKFISLLNHFSSDQRLTRYYYERADGAKLSELSVSSF